VDLDGPLACRSVLLVYFFGFLGGSFGGGGGKGLCSGGQSRVSFNGLGGLSSGFSVGMAFLTQVSGLKLHVLLPL
jgi:hypothetical protein